MPDVSETVAYRVVTTKSLAGFVASITAALVGVGTVHAMFIVPAILVQAREQTERLIESYERRVPPHDIVMRDDLAGIHVKLNGLATQEGMNNLRERLTVIESRLLTIEKNK